MKTRTKIMIPAFVVALIVALKPAPAEIIAGSSPGVDVVQVETETLRRWSGPIYEVFAWYLGGGVGSTGQVPLTSYGLSKQTLNSGNDLYTRYTVIRHLSASGANSPAGWSGAASISYANVGVVGSYGAWEAHFRIGFATGLTAGMRMMVGFAGDPLNGGTGTTINTTAEPSSVQNTIYLGFDSTDGDAILRACANGTGGSAATCSAPLGATNSLADMSVVPRFYDFQFNYDGTTLSYTIRQLNSAVDPYGSGVPTLTGTIAADLPDQEVSPLAMINVAATGVSRGLDFHHMRLSKEF